MSSLMGKVVAVFMIILVALGMYSSAYFLLTLSPDQKSTKAKSPTRELTKFTSLSNVGNIDASFISLPVGLY
jgi:hypothetical protein